MTAEETLIQDFAVLFGNKALLSIDDVAQGVGCTPKVVYNWTRRNDPARRPPRVVIGRTVRFPKTEFVRWLIKEQTRA